ncbi:MAG: tRNA pseudouridine(13) synthase TruD [Gammaproteobacteria bacterium]|nr:tRNA pseudouridine(13) synthase TruD [Gammaproteobacteria bacterium]
MNLAYAYGQPIATGVMRQSPEDFIVEEELGFEPEGEGEHIWLWIEKSGLNTEQLAKRLAQVAKVRINDVSYAGLKDRHAITRQWFTLHLKNVDPEECKQWTENGWRVLNATRGRRKLRRGGLRGNRFIITLRDVQGDRDAIEERLRLVATRGVPNYFGEQRFGHDNLANAEAMVRGEQRVPDRHLRGIYLSTLRSAIFNTVLDRRVREGTWEQALPGDALNLNGSRSFFIADEIDETIQRRLAEHDIHPTGSLWGKGELPTRGQALVLEQEIIASCPPLWTQGCEEAGMDQERRPLRLCPQGLLWQWDENSLQLSFSLPAGAYATTVVGEVVQSR